MTFLMHIVEITKTHLLDFFQCLFNDPLKSDNINKVGLKMIHYTKSGNMEFLNEAFSIYHHLTFLQLEDNLFEFACNRYMEIVPIFEGEDETESREIWFSPILEKLVDRFPHKVKYKKELGVEYFRQNENITQAIKLFEDIVDKNDTLGNIHTLLKHNIKDNLCYFMKYKHKYKIL